MISSLWYISLPLNLSSFQIRKYPGRQTHFQETARSRVVVASTPATKTGWKQTSLVYVSLICLPLTCIQLYYKYWHVIFSVTKDSKFKAFVYNRVCQDFVWVNIGISAMNIYGSICQGTKVTLFMSWIFKLWKTAVQEWVIIESFWKHE